MRHTADAEDHLKILCVEDNADNIYVLKTDLRALAFPSARTRPRLAASKEEPRPALTVAPGRGLAHGFSAGRSLRRAKLSLSGSDTV
jgi:CheY-like chemotaxis protein